MGRLLPIVLVLLPTGLSGCLLVGPPVAFGVLFAAADKGTKFRYDAPLERIRSELDAFCKDEAIDISSVENGAHQALRKGRTSTNRRVRLEAMRWDDVTTIVFICVGMSGDTLAAGQMHLRFAQRLR